MKSEKNVVTVSGTIDRTQSKKMGVNQKNLGNLLSILSNMYEDSYEAVLREYAANGFDSHVEAGQTRAVEITLPSEWQPSLIIRDYGVGMSLDTMLTVYSEYLTSTKEETDDQVGGFGIGAKSAFTLGQQFIVTGIKDGRKAVVLFSLDEDNVGETTVMYDGESDEEQGVSVSLAVEDVDRMRETSVRVFRTWAPGTVLVDGVAPANVFANATDVNDTTTFVPDSSGTVYATLGPVAYPINRKILVQVAKHLESLGHESASVVATTLAGWSNQTTTDVYFKGAVGTMTVAPNREGLRDTKKTIATLSSLVLALTQDTVDSVQAKVDAARSHFEAASILHKQQEAIAPLKISRKDITFGGRAMAKVTASVDLHNLVLGTKNYRSTTQVVLDHPSVEFSIEQAEHAVVVTGLNPADFGKVRRFAKRFLEGTDYNRIFLTEATACQFGWFVFGVEGGVPTMTLDEYRTVLRSLRTTTVRAVNEPSYTVGVGERATRDVDDRETLTPITAEGKDIIVCWEKAPAGHLVEAALADYTVVVMLGTQSEDALRKRVDADGSVKVSDLDINVVIRDYAQSVYDTTTDDERVALGAVAWLANNHRASWNNNLSTWERWAETLPEVDFSRWIDDITAAYEVAEFMAHDVSLARRQELDSVGRWLGKSVVFPAFEYEIPDFDEVFPLAARVNRHDLDLSNRWFASSPAKQVLRADVLTYLNAKIAG